MTGMERVAAALREYGTVERTEEVAKVIRYVDGVWYIPLGEGEQLRVEQASLPHAVAELLALYAGGVGSGNDARRSVSAWLSGEREEDGEALAGWLRELGWADAKGAVVLLEFARAAEPGTAEEAVALLQELIEPEQAVVVAQGSKRVFVLVPIEEVAEQNQRQALSTNGTNAHVRDAHARDAHARDAHARDAHARDAHARDAHVRGAHARDAYVRGAHVRDAHVRDAHARDAHARDAHARDAHARDAHASFCSLADLREAVSAWVDTLGAELFLLSRAGVSGVQELPELAFAKREAEFALEAGKLLPGKDAVHTYERLGIARLLHGAPEKVRQEFVQEILPADVLDAMTPELRETAAAFVEHGQQVADTARALFVHRNTLLYRLERIHELTGCDPRHPLDGWTLWLALLLLRSRCTS